MPIIQYCLPSRNKALKKLLHTYWEVCPKHDDNGKLKQEMILVVNAIRNDLVRLWSCLYGDAELTSPPESPQRIYSRGNTTLAAKVKGRRAP